MKAMKLHMNYIQREGREFVELPVEEFEILQELAEDMEDLRELEDSIERQRDAPTIALDELRIKLGIKPDTDKA